MPPFSHLTSFTPTKSKFYLVNTLVVAAVSEPDLYRFVTFQVINLMSLFRGLGRTKVSVQVRSFLFECFCNKIYFDGEELTASCLNPKLEDNPLSAVSDCLFNISAATLHIAGRFSIRKLRTRHAVVTGTHLTRS